MTETALSEERAKIAEIRRLVFINMANGCSKEQMMKSFSLSEAEVDRCFDFVSRKVGWYVFSRAMPFIPHATLGDVRTNRRALFNILNKLGPVSLSSDEMAPRVSNKPLDQTPETFEMVSQVSAKQQAAAQ